MSTREKRSEVSEFYLACRNGDVKFVKNYLMDLPDIKWNPNQFESSVKSTPLHAASYYGHKEIVQLLIEYGCDRSQINGYGLTAYEEAANDEIRQLYKRPIDSSSGTHRFRDDTTDGCFDFVKRPKETINEVTTRRDNYQKTKKSPSIEGYGTYAEKQRELGYSTTSIAMCQSKLGRFITDKVRRGAPMSLKTMGKRLQYMIDQEITARKDPQSKKANELLNKFLNGFDNENVEDLIRLYTLETNFYRALKQNPMPLALPLYIASQSMKTRHFQGQSYRGAKLDDDDIATYQWAVNNRGSLLQTRHFSSTSMLRSVAEEFLTFASKDEDNIPRQPALVIFNFPEKCDQTINLSRISDEHPCLSEFEDEAEILILPWTLFQVDSVKKESPSSPYIISLTNVLLPHKSMLSSLKWILTHFKGSLNRFHEHFDEKQPEVVVTELMDRVNFPVTDADERSLKRKD